MTHTNCCFSFFNWKEFWGVRGLSCSALTEGTSVGEERKDDIKGDGQELPAVNRTIMPGDSSGTNDLDSLHSSQGGDEHSVTEYVIVRTVLYSTRENVNILHECFRQVMHLTLRICVLFFLQL